MRKFGAAAFIGLWLVACAGNGKGLDNGGRPLSEGGASGALSADFSSIQTNVFTPICVACHTGASAPQGLRLDEANSYNLLVGIPSTEAPSVLRVRAGDPNNSYLIQKLEGRAAVGAQMPFGGPPLPVATIAFIRQWITDGAARPATAATGAVAAFQLSSIAPADGDSLAQAPSSIVMGFTRELDLTRVNAASVQLQRVTASTGDAESIAIDVSVPHANSMAIVLLPHSALAAGRYRVIVDGQPGNEITDLVGQRLSALLPATGGPTIVASFWVDGAR